MNSIEIRFADKNDHDHLVLFYGSYYKPGHPLFNIDFWQWQFGNPNLGGSIIALNEEQEIVGHMGCVVGGPMVWLINILINKAYSGQGIISKFFSTARQFGPIAVAVANVAGQSLLAKRQWYRYADLQRYVLTNPGINSKAISELVQPVTVQTSALKKPTGHYWLQPGLNGVVLDDGSTSTVQNEVGGLRFFDLVDPVQAAEQAWKMGFNWIDYIASCNHPLCRELEKNGWNKDTGLPWYLNPVDLNIRIDLNLFSEEPLPKDFLFHRSYADIGRVGRISDP